jgi:hypothetical protein
VGDAAVQPALVEQGAVFVGVAAGSTQYPLDAAALGVRLI